MNAKERSIFVMTMFLASSLGRFLRAKCEEGLSSPTSLRAENDRASMWVTTARTGIRPGLLAGPSEDAEGKWRCEVVRNLHAHDRFEKHHRDFG
jgi:hypothetical protein